MDTALVEHITEALAGRFAIERPIGRGGMAMVFLAREHHPSREVAVKVLDPALTDRLGRTRFVREVEIVSKLTHPHIVPVFSAGEAEGFLYYVMPYIAGQSLRQRLARERVLPLDEALHVAHDVADALKYAHASGVVHRDIKPENILLAGGHALVADFGIARALSMASENKLTMAGLPIGTPGYMSPEQATGGEVDARTDIYSLACVLHEMLYGEAPSLTDSAGGSVPGATTSTQGPSATVDTVPKTVTTTLSRALAWNPAHRFATTAEFAEALSGGDGHTTPHTAPPHQVPRQSIAVLPFANLSNDPENEYFSDGITDDIITLISKVENLKVTSRTSAMRYRNSEKPLHDIGSELGVATVLEGSVRRVGQRVRITAQLIDVNSDAHLWAETYDRDLTDIFEIQSDVAGQIARALRSALSPKEQTRIRKKPTEDIEAYHQYLRGVYYLNRFTADSSNRALQSFQHAIQRDPQFALGYVGLANVYLSLALGTGSLDPRSAFSAAQEAAERALELDPTLVDAHGTVGAVHTLWDWNWEAAEAAFGRANWSCTECEKPHVKHAFYLAARGRHDEGIEHAKAALELDPVSLIVNTHVALQYYWARQFDRAAHQIDRTLELDGRFPPALSLAGWVHLLTGRADHAVKPLERALKTAGRTSPYLAALGCAYATVGKTDGAAAILQEMLQLSEKQYVSPRDVALLKTWLGQTDEALHWLERAYETRAPWMAYLSVDPIWDRLREEPRFATLTGKIRPA